MNILAKKILQHSLSSNISHITAAFFARTSPYATFSVKNTQRSVPYVSISNNTNFFIPPKHLPSFVKMPHFYFASGNHTHLSISSLDVPTHKKLTMPSLSPTMERGNIIEWKKKEGEKIAPGDVVASIETDKAVVDFEVNEDGYLAKILFPAGSKDVKLGEVIGILVENEKDLAAFKDYKPGQAASAEPPKPAQKEKPKEAEKEKPKEAEKEKPKEKVKEKEKEPEPKVEKEKEKPKDERIIASPLAKKSAREKEINLSEIEGTGPKGRIIQADVLEKEKKKEKEKEKVKPKEAPKPKAAVPLPAIAEYEDVELNNIKKITAERLLLSKTSIPHFYVSSELNMDKIMNLRAELNKYSPSKLTVNHMIIKAAALACTKVPEANASFHRDFIRKYKNVDMSVAVQTDNGLITPIVFSANSKGLGQIAKEMAELQDKAKKRKLKPQEFQGGTFTISNMGMYGIDFFSAVINPPQVCILAIGKTARKVVEDEKAKDKANPFKVVNVMKVTLSSDHRVVDGAVAAKWMQEFKNMIENPNLMLL